MASPARANAWQRQPSQPIPRRSQLRHGSIIPSVPRSVGIVAECEVIAGTNHFTIVDEPVRPGSALLTRILAMAQEGASETE